MGLKNKCSSEKKVALSQVVLEMLAAYRHIEHHQDVCICLKKGHKQGDRGKVYKNGNCKT